MEGNFFLIFYNRSNSLLEDFLEIRMDEIQDGFPNNLPGICSAQKPDSSRIDRNNLALAVNDDGMRGDLGESPIVFLNFPEGFFRQLELGCRLF